MSTKNEGKFWSTRDLTRDTPQVKNSSSKKHTFSSSRQPRKLPFQIHEEREELKPS